MAGLGVARGRGAVEAVVSLGGIPVAGQSWEFGVVAGVSCVAGC